MVELKDIILFELEGTITFPFCQINQNVKPILLQLVKKNYSLALISSRSYQQIKLQLKNNHNLFDYIFTDDGMTIYKKYKNTLSLFETNDLKKKITENEIQKLINFILQWISKTSLPYKRGNFIQFNQTNILVYPIGFNSNYQEKKIFNKFNNIYKISKNLVNELSIKFNKFNYIIEKDRINITIKDWGRNYSSKFLNFEYNKIIFFGNDIPLNKNIFENKRIICFKTNSTKDTLSKINHTILNNKNIVIKKFFNWNNILNVKTNDLVDYSKLFDSKSDWNKLAIMKINYKSIYTKNIKFGLSYLQLTIKQIMKINYINNTNIPLILINFNNDDLVNKIIPNISILKIYIIKCKFNNFQEIINEFIKSDVYLELIQNKKENLFISSIDNISAIPCSNILSYIQSEELDLLIETTKRKYIDSKSSFIVKYKSKFKILDLNMVPILYKHLFFNTKKFTTMFTGNLWINLNNINIDYNNSNFINQFNKIIVLNVPRDRYVSYKKYKALGKLKNLFNSNITI